MIPFRTNQTDTPSEGGLTLGHPHEPAVLRWKMLLKATCGSGGEVIEPLFPRRARSEALLHNGYWWGCRVGKRQPPVQGLCSRFSS